MGRAADLGQLGPGQRVDDPAQAGWWDERVALAAQDEHRCPGAGQAGGGVVPGRGAEVAGAAATAGSLSAAATQQAQAQQKQIVDQLKSAQDAGAARAASAAD